MKAYGVGGQPLYLKVYEYYKEQIEDGRLPPGARMPSIRKCACQLAVSRTTAQSAYFQLAADGYLVPRPRSGYYVTDLAAERAAAPAPGPAQAPAPRPIPPRTRPRLRAVICLESLSSGS